MKSSSILSRYRLVINLLALVIALTAWAYAPPPVAANPAWCEEMGCVEWSAESGCTATMFCCLFNDGGVMCWQNGQLVQ
jgi:hypothetical protein